MSAVALAAALVLAAAPARAAAGRVIAGDETLEGPVVVAGRWVVTGTLRLRGADVLVLPGGAIEVADAGTLIGERAPSGLFGPGRARITSFGSAPAVSVATGGTARLADTDLLGASIDSAGGLSAERVTAQRAPRAAFLLTGGTALFDEVSVTDPGAEGLRAMDAAVTARALTIDRAARYAIHVSGGSLDARALAVRAALDYGVRADAASIAIEDARLSSHCGIYLSDGTSGSVTGSRIDASSHGITLAHAGAVAVERNVFDGAGTAVLVTGGDPVIEANSFAGGTVGVWAASAPVVAEGNWWSGVPGTQGAARAEGPVDVDPWLTEAPV